MSIVLDTPEQINMWVLLSRRGQLKMHLAGYTQKGLVAWFKRNLPTGENGKPVRTAKDCIVPLEYAILEAGGKVDYSLVNVHVMVHLGGHAYLDAGIVSDMSEVEANPDWVRLYEDGKLELILTTQEPRERKQGEMFVPA